MSRSRFLLLFLSLCYLAHVRCQDAVTQLDGKQLSEDQLRQAHAAIDANSDREASREELVTFLERHTRDKALATVHIDEDFKQKDTSEDGHISLEEHLKGNQALQNFAATVSDIAATSRDPVIVEKANKLLDSERKSEIELFNAADTNNNGLLELPELPNLLFPGTHDKSLDVLVKSSIEGADVDNNGKLNLEEFLESGLGDGKEDGDTGIVPKKLVNLMMAHQVPADKEGVSKQLFSRLDANSDGYLDHQELRSLQSGRIHQEDLVHNLIKRLDKDDDKHIDSDELITMSNGDVQDGELQEYLIAWARKRPIMSGR